MTDTEITEHLATDFLGWQPASSYAWRLPDGARVWRRDFAPLTDARACALVKAELRRRGWILDLILYPNSARSHVRTGVVVGVESLVLTVADTEERAVCVAALRAVGVEG